MLSKLKALYPILLLTAGHGAVDSYVGLLQIVAPGLSSYLDIPLGDLVMLVGLATFLNNALQPFIGHVMGVRNLNWVLWFAVPLSALPVFMGYTSGFWSLVILIVLGSIGTGLYHPEAVLSAHDATGESAYLGIPLFMAGGAAIYAVFTPLSIRVSESCGFPALAWLGLPGLVVGVLFFLQYRNRRKTHPSLVIRPRSKRITKKVAGTLSFWPLLAVGICFCVGNGLFMSILSSHYELTFGPESRQWSGWILMTLGIAGSLSSFGWSSLARKRNFYVIVLVTQIISVPLLLLMARPSAPWVGLLLAIPLSVVAPAAIHPVGVTLSRDSAGSTQAMRTALMIGGAYGVSSLAIVAAGILLRRDLPSSWLILFVAACSLAALLIAAWQLLAVRKSGQRA